MEGYVLAFNTPLRQLASVLGFVDTRSPADATLRVAKLSLAGGSWDDRQPEPQS